MGVFQNNLMGAAAAAASAGGGGFYSHQIAHSIRNSSSQSGNLTRTAGTPTSSTTFTMSYWVKRYTTSTAGDDTNIFVTGTGGASYAFMAFGGNAWQFQPYGGSWGATGGITMNTTALYRDTSSWYHHVIIWDTTQSTQANRVKMYVNGERITSFSTEGVTGQLAQDEALSYINQSGVVQAFGGHASYGHGTVGADLQMAEIVFNDGQAYGPDSYGETKNGVWIPKDPSGLTFGNNGYYLNFAASGDLGNDVSGNNNDFTVANIASHDQMLDSPTFNSDSNGGNFCAWNILSRTNPALSYGATTFSEGNLAFAGATGGTASTGSTFSMQSGKWYAEIMQSGSPAGGWPGVGVIYTDKMGTAQGTSNIQPQNGFTAYIAMTNGYVYKFDGSSGASYGSAFGNGDICNIAVDIDAGKIWWGKNGTYFASGNPATGANPGDTFTAGTTLSLWVAGYNGNGTSILNAGQDGTFAGAKTAQGNSDDTGYGNFYYNPPTAFLALCSGNLPTADAVDPAQTDNDFPQKLFNAQLWTGNGSSGRAITIDMAKKPSLSSIKQRNATNSWNVWTQGNNNGDYDSFGEFNSTAAWYQNQGGSGPYTADPTASALTLSAYGQVNASSQTYVNYKWVANGGTTSTNTAGDIDSTVEVDPSGGFSVVQYTGTLSSSGVQTVGHGLSKAPSMFISKSLTTSGNWWVFSDGQTSWNYGLNLQGTGASVDKSGNGSMSAPTSTVFSTNYTDGLNETNKAMIAFCFADIEGYIKSGSFEGNGNTDGPFVYTGFRPSLVIRRRFDGSGSWIAKDDVRNPTNDGSIEVLTLNSNGAENPQTETSDGVDFLSNGFKVKATNNGSNGNGLDYIYLAFAKNPFQYSTAF